MKTPAAERPTPGPRRALLRGLAGAALCPVGLVLAQDEFGRAGLKGAGSTFVHPLAARWVQEYRHHRAGGIQHVTPNGGLDDDMNGPALDYEPIGSVAGLQRLRAGGVDFAFSEMPLPSAELRRLGLRQVPLVLGAIAVAANLGHAGPQTLTLSGEVLADIYLGRIQRWNDPALRALNPTLTLPDAAIVPLHRSDGSGTTYTLTHYLAQHSADFKSRIGAEAQVRWPTGQAVRGSSGMADALRRTPNSLGYLDAVQARGAGVTVAALRNRAGRAVRPDMESAAAAAQAARWDASTDFAHLLIDATGDASYPVVASVYGMFPDAPQQARARRTVAFLDWALLEGRRSAEQLGYLPLPVAAIETVRGTLSTAH